MLTLLEMVSVRGTRTGTGTGTGIATRGVIEITDGRRGSDMMTGDGDDG